MALATPFFNLPPEGWGQPDEPPGSGKGLVEAMEKVGASANSHIWYAGQGIPDALQGAMIKVRIFESVQAWGDSYTAFIENDMASSPEWAAMASQVDCGPIRSYLGRAFYERNAD